MYLHLDQLKRRLVPPELVAATRIDDRLGPMAAGIACRFDVVCGRRLVRQSRQEAHEAGGALIVLDAYPVSRVSSIALVRGDGSTEDIVGAAKLIAKSSGYIRFGRSMGDITDEIVVSYDGGYWVDLSAEGDGRPPDGAMPMPADLLDAWVAQCDYESRVRRLYGVSASGGTSGKEVADPLASDIDLLPAVQRVLRQYTRIA